MRLAVGATCDLKEGRRHVWELAASLVRGGRTPSRGSLERSLWAAPRG